MRAYVFTDGALTRHAGQFVWLSIDTENKKNAAFVEKYPIKAWPSFYVIDASREKIALRWVGGATVAELDKLFAEGAHAGSGKPAADPALARADALYSEGRYAESIPSYQAALKSLPKGSASHTRAIESLLFSYSVADRPADCAALARESLASLRHTPAAAFLAGGGLDCALQLPPEAPGRAASVASLEKDALALLADPKLPLAADDRSALYGSLFDAREDAKDAAGARKLAHEWVADMDAAAAAAKTPEQWTALDPNRYSAYKAAGEIEKAIPMLEKSEKYFPNDYNPPARLASAYLSLKRYDEALAAADRALALVYGPRKLRVLATKAEIYKGMGNSEAERRTVEEALAYAEALPPGQKSESAVASLKKRLGSAPPGGCR